MKVLKHYRLRPDHSVEEFEIRSDADLVEWARGIGRPDWRVDFTEIADGVTVSTVFLGLDHNFSRRGPPIVFETMVFTDYGGGDCWRWSSWNDAVAGHQNAVADQRRRLALKKEASE